MTKDQFLTLRWNNLLTVGLGLPTLLVLIAGIAPSGPSDRAAFIGMAIIGALY